MKTSFSLVLILCLAGSLFSQTHSFSGNFKQDIQSLLPEGKHTIKFVSYEGSTFENDTASLSIRYGGKWIFLKGTGPLADLDEIKVHRKNQKVFFGENMLALWGQFSMNAVMEPLNSTYKGYDWRLRYSNAKTSTLDNPPNLEELENHIQVKYKLVLAQLETNKKTYIEVHIEEFRGSQYQRMLHIPFSF